MSVAPSRCPAEVQPTDGTFFRIFDPFGLQAEIWLEGYPRIGSSHNLHRYIQHGALSFQSLG